MKNPIIFYDASCPFCSKVVRFILRHEKNKILKFSSLQGDFAKSFLSTRGVYEIDMSTFYLFKNGKLFQAISFYKNKKSYLVKKNNDTIIEEEIPSLNLI